MTHAPVAFFAAADSEAVLSSPLFHGKDIKKKQKTPEYVISVEV